MSDSGVSNFAASPDVLKRNRSHCEAPAVGCGGSCSVSIAGPPDVVDGSRSAPRVNTVGVSLTGPSLTG